ncbi:FAD binding domain-containing protein [Mycena metata]|uniref:FAD binding domain-containing protein n=1 Tax=Mycena metata TaxID=1033252 RepID=A0AAD7JDH1_9AGAR|nr:FAD binding domain-containing protein [Mycena metata]
MVSRKYLAGLLALVTCATSKATPAILPNQALFSVDIWQRHTELASQLGPILSQGASIYFEGTPQFKEQTARWQLFAPPQFHIAVEVMEERDVQYTVLLANSFGLPWLAVSGRHGSTSTLHKLRHGVQISLSKLNDITMNPDGQTANFGGGVLSKKVTDTLWAWGKQTVTGQCECTSLAGPLLGGGHGWLQGRYGLMIDQLVEARVVLADGSLVTASNEENPDLFWALRGAGHNFGIVTQVKYKIYDVPKDNQWVFASLIFTEDKLEKIFELANDISKDGLQPVELISMIWLLRIPGVDQPVVNIYILYEGSLAESEEHLNRYMALDPTNSTVVQNVDYPQISFLANSGEEGVACAHSVYRARLFPTSFRSYHIPTIRKLFNKFSEVSARPGLNSSFYLFEAYSVKGVQTVDPESTAFPDRFNIFLTAPVLVYFDADLDEQSVKLGQEIREIALGGVEDGLQSSYVNYAQGDETLEDWYGHETWRTDKLKALKDKYDPHNRFAFYAPIIQ